VCACVIVGWEEIYDSAAVDYTGRRSYGWSPRRASHWRTGNLDKLPSLILPPIQQQQQPTTVIAPFQCTVPTLQLTISRGICLHAPQIRHVADIARVYKLYLLTKNRDDVYLQPSHQRICMLLYNGPLLRVFCPSLWLIN